MPTRPDFVDHAHREPRPRSSPPLDYTALGRQVGDAMAYRVIPGRVQIVDREPRLARVIPGRVQLVDRADKWASILLILAANLGILYLVAHLLASAGICAPA